MKAYVKTYMVYFGYDISDWIPCECGCGKQSTEIHHLQPRSRAKAKLNMIDNLCAVCRECHIEAGKSQSFNEQLKLIPPEKATFS